MAKLKLHLDADTSIKSLQSALVSKGYDVTRTPNEWMPEDASDEIQLLRSTAQGRCIFTFNIRDFHSESVAVPTTRWHNSSCSK